MPDDKKPKGPISFLNQYYKSPKFKERFLKTNTEADYKTAMLNADKAAVAYKPFVLQKDEGGVGSRVGNRFLNDMFSKQAGEEIPDDTTSILSNPQAKELKADLLNDILPHEYTHSTRDLGFTDQLWFAAKNKNPKVMKLLGAWQKSDTRNTAEKDNFSTWMAHNIEGGHDNQPNENYSDMNSLRYLLRKQNIYDAGTQDFTPEHLKKATSDPYINKQFNFKRLRNTFTDDNLIYLMNKVAVNEDKNEPIMQAKKGGFIPKAKNGIFLKNIFGGGEGDEDDMDKQDKLAQNIDMGVGLATDFAAAFTGEGEYKKGAKGKAIGGGIGAGAGALIGMPGVGAKVGSFIGGFIGGRKDNKDMAEDAYEADRRGYSANTLQPNMMNFGNQYEDGGATGPDIPQGADATAAPQQPAPPQTRKINVEKGELMVDPSTGEVVRKFSNPNRFGSHEKKQMKEPIGNFVELPTNMIIVPKKDAARYERGDKLTRSSVLKRLLMEQATDPMHNVPEEMQPEGAEAPQYAAGGFTGDPNMPYSKTNLDGYTEVDRFYRGFGSPNKAANKQMNAPGKNSGMNYNGVVAPDGRQIDNPSMFESMFTEAKHYDRSTIREAAVHPSELRNPVTFPQSALSNKLKFTGDDIIDARNIPVAANGMFTGPGPSTGKKLDFSTIKKTAGIDLSQILNPGTPIEQQWATEDAVPSIEDGLGEDVTNTDTTVKKAMGTNLSALLRRTSQNLPIYAQMANAAQGDPFLSFNPNNGYNDAMGIANQLPEEVSIAGNLAANNEGFASASKMIANNDTPSARAEAGELWARKMVGDNQVYSGANQANIGLKSAKLGQIMNLTTANGADSQAARRELMTEQRMDKAARENMLAAGAANLNKNNMQASNDMESIRAINEVTKFVNVNPYAKKLVEQDPNALAYIVSYMKITKGATMTDAIKSYDKSKTSTTKTKTEGKEKVSTTTKS